MQWEINDKWVRGVRVQREREKNSDFAMHSPIKHTHTHTHTSYSGYIYSEILCFMHI